MDLYTYDNDGRELSHTRQKSDGSQAITTSAKYDKAGNKRFETDGNGTTIEYTYEALNRLISKTVYVTNGSGQKIKQTTTYGYDKNGNLVSETDWLGNTTTNVYDELDRLIRKLDQYGKVIQRLEYNPNGTQSKYYDALGNVTQYFYDKNKRLIKTIDPEGHIILQHYDEVGNIDQKTDGNNNTTYYSYDEFNRLVSVKNAKGEITNYTYDLNGNMLTQVDAQGNVTSYEYNVANKIIRIINDGGRTGTPGNYSYDPAKTETYTYYANGNLKTKLDRNGKLSTYTYDIHGRKISETIGSITISYTYDNNGNQLTITDSTGTTTRTYDELNSVTSKTVPNVGTARYEYDIISGIEGLEEGCRAESSTDPKGNVTIKIYDKAGRLYKVIVNGNTTTYKYYDNGNLHSVTYPNGYSEEYEYYKNNQLKKLTNKKADGTAIETFTYYYDGANNITSKVDSKGTTNYTYDEVNRLLTVLEPSGKLTSYTYTAAGNRDTETIKEDANITVKRYTYDSLNRLQSVITEVNGVVVEVVTYTFDNNGNQLTSTEVVYIDGQAQEAKITTNIYDDLNQLIQTITPDRGTIKHIYNGEGIRVAKEVNGKITRYLYEGDKVVLELDGEGKEKARNIYGISLLVRIADGKIAYYFYNGHGDTSKLIGEDGSILNSYYYDAFGNNIEVNETIENPYRYVGYQYDSETETYYIMCRMYDPAIGRFLQEDTYRGDINDPLSLNLYTYCFNSPIVYWDPSGHKYVKRYDGSMLRTFWEDDITYTFENGQMKKHVVKEYDFWKDETFFTKNWWKDQNKVLTALTKINNEIEAHGEEAYVRPYKTNKNDIVSWRRLNVIEAVLGVKVTQPGEYDGRGDIANAIDAIQVKYDIEPLIEDSFAIRRAELVGLFDRVNERIEKTDTSFFWKLYYKIGDFLQTDGFYYDIYSATVTGTIGFAGSYESTSSKGTNANKVNQAKSQSTTKTTQTVKNKLEIKNPKDAGLKVVNKGVTQADNIITDPSRMLPAGNGKGGALVIEHSTNPKVKFSDSEIKAANHMYQQGNDVILRHPIGTRTGGGTSDLLVNGIKYDVYTPKTNSVSRIIGEMAKKNSQTTGIVLDLAETSVNAEDLGNVLARVTEVIKKGGKNANINDIRIIK